MLLDVGSGAHPHPRAGVTCDLFFNAENEGGSVKIKNNFVICDAQHLPFKPQSFEESNCTHVLEHLKNPQSGFSELKRVSKKGYVETPSVLYENILFGYPFHHWFFVKKNGKVYFSKSWRLIIRGKTILPLGWFLHKLTLHEKFASLVLPIRRIPLFYMHYWWPL